MTPNKDLFISFKEINDDKVVMETNDACNIVGKCTMQLKLLKVLKEH